MDSILRRLATFNVVIIEYPHNQTRVECLRAHFLDEVVNLPIQIPRPDIRELRVPAIPEDIVMVSPTESLIGSIIDTQLAIVSPSKLE